MECYIVVKGFYYYIEFIRDGKVVDRSGPFDDEADAMAAVERAQEY